MKVAANSPKLLLVGTLPLIPTGQSVLFKMLADELNKRKILYNLLDFHPSSWSNRRGGVFSWTRAFELLGKFPRYIYYLVGTRRTIYLLIGQSTVSFLRDCYFIWTATLFGHRIVAHLKGGNYDDFYHEQPRFMQWLIMKTLNRVEKIIVLSELFKNHFNFLPEAKKKIAVIPNCLPFDLEKTAPHTYLSPGAPIRILYLSNMVETKGYWEVLKACRILKQRNVTFRCDFCGEFLASNDDKLYDSASEARTAFIRAIKEWKLEKEVRWQGSVRREKKTWQLHNAHCFVLPTKYINEGQPVSIIEALAFGKVIISTQYRAIPDILSDGYNGFIIKSDAPEQMADRIEWLWKHPAELSRMSKNSLSKYKKHFTKEKHLSKLLALLYDNSSKVKK